MIIAVVFLVLVFIMSMQDIQFLVKAQATCLFANIITTLITAVLILTCGHWSFSNIVESFGFTNIDPSLGIPGWIIGMALLITPYFGFETVPQMVEEGDFPTSNAKKAICGSVITCGAIYAIFFFCVAGLAPADELLAGDAANGFMTITAMQNILGWRFWPVVYGLVSILMGMTASILGFWMSTVRMLYSMWQEELPAGGLHQGQQASAADPAEHLPAGHQPGVHPAAERRHVHERLLQPDVVRLRLRLRHHDGLGRAHAP